MSSAQPSSNGPQAADAAPGPQAQRIVDPVEILTVFKALLEQHAVLHLMASDGSSHSATLWAVDPRQRRLALTADLSSPSLSQIVAAEEAVATTYLDRVRVQFDLLDRLLVHGPRTTVLQVRLPQELYRFQRRAHPRVATPVDQAVLALFRHPQVPDMRLELRVLDVSLGGCALLLPHDVPAVSPGVLIQGARLQLDAETRLKAALLVHHVTSFGMGEEGVRLGCGLQQLDATSERVLQRYIDVTQKSVRRNSGTTLRRGTARDMGG